MSSKFLTESTGKKIVKIGQYLAKIWTKNDSLVFFGPPCIYIYIYYKIVQEVQKNNSNYLPTCGPCSATAVTVKVADEAATPLPSQPRWQNWFYLNRLWWWLLIPRVPTLLLTKKFRTFPGLSRTATRNFPGPFHRPRMLTYKEKKKPEAWKADSGNGVPAS